MFAVNQLFQWQLRTAASASPTPQAPFDTVRAMRHVRIIAARPRWVSTKALDEAMRYIYSELDALKPVADNHGMELDLEYMRSGPGSYVVDIANIDLVTSYSNLSNVVARLRPKHLPYDTDMRTLLINAHVDSAVSAPGASDNVCGVGVVMEVIRCIASSDVLKLSRPLVLLFNGAEEAVLPAAHAFVKQHPWAKGIAAHINLESLGAGDAYHLFRVGPHSPWLVEAFANAVSMPSTSVSASDLFESKVSPLRRFTRLEHPTIECRALFRS